MGEFDVPDPDHIRDLADAARSTPESFEALINTQAIMYLIEHSEDGQIAIPAEELERYGTGETGKVLLAHRVDGDWIFQVADDPPSANAQAVLDGGADWLRTETGQAVRVTGADGDQVVFVVALANGGWSEPQRYHSECFLRDHVLAAGVPLLGGVPPLPDTGSWERHGDYDG